MLGRSVYLAGPIDNCTEEEIWAWRNHATELLKPMHCFSPCRRSFKGYVEAGMDSSWITKEIVALDKAEIAASDALLVNYNEPAAGSRMTGTTMEIIYAFDMGKLVVVVTKEPKVSSWVNYHAHRVFPTLEEGADYIKHFFS